MFRIRNLDLRFQSWSFAKAFENCTAIRRSNTLIRCTLGLILAMFGVGSRYLMIPYWGLGPPLTTFYPATLLAVVFGGWVSGLIATGACVLAADYFFLGPFYSLRAEQGGFFALALFAAVSLLMILFVEILIRARETGRREKCEAAALAEIARKAQHEAEQASKAKDEFMAMVSHELRSPLHVILGGIQTLKQKQQCFSDQTSSIFEMIERSAKTEARLIEDLLDVCRYSNGKMSLRRKACRIRSLIETTMVSMRPDFDAKQLNASFKMLGADKEVLVDPQRLQQITTNLLNNAIKFTDPGGWIMVELDERPFSVELRVSDSGIGIEKQLQSQLFEPFRQGEGAQQKGGLGLGLAIVSNIARLHGGTVQVQSEGLHRGATFTVRLPTF